MMKLACKDLNPSTTCNFVATGSSQVKVASKMMEHAKANHAGDLAGMSDDKIMNMMESKVHE
jgi:predicted small metal-binding protein